jgi:hypothetical protein
VDVEKSLSELRSLGQAKLTWPCGPPKKMKVAGRALPRVEGLSRKINNLDATLETKHVPRRKTGIPYWPGA